ncbi:unnamed protein product [Callosobruchus maculatus]|uniref:THAP-type domain-containing protein n=1 Tax=Callosobruchus maculatus TaxID=64391 RepID=A0A653C1D7_CALMS|nr:unnamed protein product [Callosobruchus maculatus]
MPRRCCVPGCKENYDTTLKKTKTPVSTFSFPKEEKQREKWLRAIPRKDWIPTTTSAVCANHFCESEIVRFNEFKLPNGQINKVMLKYPKLSKNAVPSNFPNLPKYLSSEIKEGRSDPETRRAAIVQRNEDLFKNFMDNDMIVGFDDLKLNLEKIYSSKWEVKADDVSIYFYNLSTIDKCLSINNTIHIDQSMQVTVFHKGNKLSPNDLKWILPCDLKLERWSQLTNLLSRYSLNNDSVQSNPITDLLNQAIDSLSKAYVKCEEDESFAYTKHLEIIIDQLIQMVSKKNRYCPATIIMSFIIYSQSPSCYKLIRDFFVLPHKRYLQSISASLNVSPKNDLNNKNYLLNVAETLSDTEKVVSLIIDEIYISTRLDYRSHSIVGSAENENRSAGCEFAKTIVTFMISSVFGKMNEVVKLWPVNNVKGIELAEMSKYVIDFVQSCNFEVLCVISDNHSINRIMFKSLSDNGFWFPNPKDSEKAIFLLFDFVHIFKNIWKNWLNLKNLYNTFVFCDFTSDKLKYAKLQDIKNIYEKEKTLLTKQAYKLNFKSLYPSNLERQKVHLADNVFHQSTISSLKCTPEYQDTADFVEIIRRWWDIVNTRNVLKGTLKRNEWSKPFENISDVRIDFLEKFVNWLDKWHNIENNNGHLTNETFQAIRQSTIVLVKLIRYCFEHYAIKYILPGKFTSENLEKRFGIYRVLSGCNYNVSLDDVLAAEKKIRVKHIFQNINKSFSLSDIREQFSLITDDDIEETFETHGLLANEFISILNTNYLQVSDVDDATKIYISGYASHTISKKLNNCGSCISIITMSKGNLTGNKYFDNLQRNGLSIATDRVCYIFYHMASIMQYIMNNKDCEAKFLKFNQHKFILCKLTIESIKSDIYYNDFQNICEECGTSYEKILNMICSVLSNVFLNNFIKIKNNNNFESQKLKKKRSEEPTQNTQKQRKLGTFKK